MNRKDILIKISMTISAFMMFFGFYVANLFVLQFISIAFIAFYYLLTKNKLTIRKDTVAWLFFLVVSIISIINSVSKTDSLEIVLLFACVIFIKVAYENIGSDWQSFFIKLVGVFSFVHVAATIIQLLVPSLIGAINSIILSPVSQAYNTMFYESGSYAGITAQTTLTAFYISIFIIVIFCKILVKKQARRNIILLILGLIALFLTGKRGYLLFVIATMMIMFLYSVIKDKKKALKYIFILSLVLFSINVVLTKIPQTQVVFNKMAALEDYGDVTNGRDKLWSESLDLYYNNPVMGVGIGNTSQYIGEYTHNVYIQLLAETGSIGLIVYVIAVYCSLIRTIKEINREFDKTNKYYYYLITSLSLQIFYILLCFTGNPLFSNIYLTMYAVSISMCNKKVKELTR